MLKDYLVLLAVELKLVLVVRVLDGQAPDVEIVANSDDDIDYKAAVDADGHAQHGEHEGDLVDVVAEGTRPTKAKALLQDWAERVAHAEADRDTENVPVGKVHLDQVSRDHLADAVGVDESSKDDEGDKVVVEDSGLEVKVHEDEGPDGEEGAEAEESTAGTVAPSAASADDVEGGLDGVEHEDDSTLDHVPLSEGHLVDIVGDAHGVRKTNPAEHALLPEVTTAHDAGEDVNKDDGQNTFNGAVDDTEGESLGVVFVPGLNVESEER